MGTYTPLQRRKKRNAPSLAETLAEAERAHYVDCPNADLPLRTAALFLDLILASLAMSAVHQLSETVRNTVPVVLGSWVSAEASGFLFFFLFVNWTLKVSLAVFYFVWTPARLGGTAAKLLLGLRVVDVTSGERLSLSRSIWREILAKPLGLLTFASPLSASLRKDHRAVHDLAVKSVVKRVRGAP